MKNIRFSTLRYESLSNAPFFKQKKTKLSDLLVTINNCFIFLELIRKTGHNDNRRDPLDHNVVQ